MQNIIEILRLSCLNVIGHGDLKNEEYMHMENNELVCKFIKEIKKFNLQTILTKRGQEEILLIVDKEGYKNIHTDILYSLLTEVVLNGVSIDILYEYIINTIKSINEHSGYPDEFKDTLKFDDSNISSLVLACVVIKISVTCEIKNISSSPR